MYFTRDFLTDMANEELELIRRYSDSYDELRACVDVSSEYDVVWTEGMAEPYYIGYINDIEKMPSRKIFAREPKNKIYSAKHFFKNGEPVYSVFMDEKGEPACEKFYSFQDNMRVGVLFYGRRLCGVSSELFDSDGKPACYRYTEIKKDMRKSEQTVSKCFVYGYEDRHIVSAWCIDSFDLSKDIAMYDDSMYLDWINQSIEYKMSVPPMNPNTVNEYRFIYGENGYPSEYSRTEYRYCNIGTGKWKAPKRIFEQLGKIGVMWFCK